MFRHRRCTDLSGLLSDRELILYFGWSIKSQMPSLYSHRTQKDVENKLLKASGVEIDEKKINPKLATVICYKCKEVNSIANKFCWKCLTPLSEEGIKETEQLTEFTKIITNAYIELLKMREISPKEFDRRMEALKELGKKKGGN